MADNASNNDTMLEGIQQRYLERGCPFSAVNARMRCVPHVIHLSACKVYECMFYILRLLIFLLLAA
jgi:hypothetical protein